MLIFFTFSLSMISPLFDPLHKEHDEWYNISLKLSASERRIKALSKNDSGLLSQSIFNIQMVIR
ncbi:hypothetical protein B9C53_01335 [Bacillus velezensis]|nr:hypothetical protein B9C53_01335 [Bacillus velezensis]